MKKKRQQRKFIKQQQKNYIQSWNIGEHKKQYTALEDPHANYYFYNKSVSNHLKVLKKAINEDKNAKQKSKLKSLIKTKLEIVKLPNIKMSPKTAIYASQINASMSELPKYFRKKSLNTLGSSTNKNSKNQPSFSVVQATRYRKTDTETQNKNSAPFIDNENEIKQSSKVENSALNKLQNQKNTNKLSHQQFLQFIVQKKKKLQQSSANLKKQQQQDAKNNKQQV